MRRKRVIVLEDNHKHFLAISAHLRRQGYSVELITSIEEAVAAAKEGASRFVFDIRLVEHNAADCGGLLAIKPVLSVRPSACVIIWSAHTAGYQDLASELGAYAVVEKRSYPGGAALAIENYFLRFDLTSGRLHFGLNWITGPLLIGSAFSWAISSTGFRFPFFSKDGSELFPLALSAIFVLTVSHAKGSSDPTIAGLHSFKRLSAARSLLLAAILGGLIYDAIKLVFFPK